MISVCTFEVITLAVTVVVVVDFAVAILTRARYRKQVNGRLKQVMMDARIKRALR